MNGFSTIRVYLSPDEPGPGTVGRCIAIPKLDATLGSFWFYKQDLLLPRMVTEPRRVRPGSFGALGKSNVIRRLDRPGRTRRTSWGDLSSAGLLQDRHDAYLLAVPLPGHALHSRRRTRSDLGVALRGFVRHCRQVVQRVDVSIRRRSRSLLVLYCRWRGRSIGVPGDWDSQARLFSRDARQILEPNEMAATSRS